MPLDIPDAVCPTHRSRGILWLVAAHIAVGLMAALLVKFTGGIDLAEAASSGIWVGQTSLLGVWCGLGATGHWKRLVGVVLSVGVLYLWIGVAVGRWSMVQFLFLGAFIAFVATPLLIARAGRIVIQADSSATTLASRLQFSVRNLLVVTFVVACVITLGKVVRPHILEWLEASEIVFYAAVLILLGVVSAWLILATKRPVSYGIGLVAMAACADYYLGFSSYLGKSASGMIAFTTTSTSLVVASLLVVRSCGYRLVRLSKPSLRGSRPAEFTKPAIGNPDSQSSPHST